MFSLVRWPVFRQPITVFMPVFVFSGLNPSRARGSFVQRRGLALYDIIHTPGVAADISHCSTPAQVTAHLGPQSLRDALEGSAVVVIPAGVPRKPGEFSRNVTVKRQP